MLKKAHLLRRETKNRIAYILVSKHKVYENTGEMEVNLKVISNQQGFHIETKGGDLLNNKGIVENTN